MTEKRYQVKTDDFYVEILDDGIPMSYLTVVNRLNEQHMYIEKLESINYQLYVKNSAYEQSLFDGRQYLTKLNRKFEKIFGISLEDFLDIEYRSD